MTFVRVLAVVGCIAVMGADAPLAAPTSETTYDMVTRAKHCTPNSADRTQQDCDYQVGKALRFGIAGVGMLDASIVFSKSDIDGDYYASYGLNHRCVIIWPGAATTKGAPGRALDVAFVSSSTGQVFRTWQSCAATTR